MLQSIITAAVIALYSCNNPVQSNRDDDTATIHRDTSGTFEFLYDCDDLEIWFGGIQGIPYSDSNMVYPLGECSSNKNYDIIWVHKGSLDYRKSLHPDSLRKIFYNDRKSGYRNFNCFAFVIGQTNHNSTDEEIEQFDYDFPAEVEVYKNEMDGWKHKGTERVNSFEELGKLKIKTIFSD